MEEEVSTLKDRINLAISKKGITKSELALKANVSKGAVTHWCNGRSKSIKNEECIKIADVLGVNVNWLISGEGPMSITNIIAIETNDIPPTDFVSIPEFHINFGAGDCPEPTYDEITDTIPATYRKTFFESKGIDYRNCKRFRVIGDSMQPLINEGDCILVDCSSTNRIIDNAVYALIYDHSLKVKRLRKTFKSLIIHSDNPAYSDEELTFEEASQMILIVGHVIERSGSI